MASNNEVAGTLFSTKRCLSRVPASADGDDGSKKGFLSHVVLLSGRTRDRTRQEPNRELQPARHSEKERGDGNNRLMRADARERTG